MRQTRPARLGVTLIEAIMVVALLAAASATGLVMFDGQWVARREVTAVVDDLADSLITARNTAIDSQSTVRVRRTRLGGAEQLQITEDPGPLRAGKIWSLELGNMARLSGSPTEIRFRPDGSSDRGLRWSVRNSRTEGEVQVSPRNGQVTRTLP